AVVGHGGAGDGDAFDRDGAFSGFARCAARFGTCLSKRGCAGRPQSVRRETTPAVEGSLSYMKGTGPLSGVRVVDLTAMVMGPYCTQMMADMGADVIKIEPPEGDNTRYISVGPVPGMSGVFVNVNRGKRSVVLDLRLEAGKTALRRLIEQADVFIHSMRSKAIAKLGLSYAEGAAIKPSIIYTNCYGYSRRG